MKGLSSVIHCGQSSAGSGIGMWSEVVVKLIFLSLSECLLSSVFANYRLLGEAAK